MPEGPDGAVIGAVPCYLKSHSRSEYVFDRGWGEAYEHACGQCCPQLSFSVLVNARGRYSHKPQVSLPFTPAGGRRLLVRPSPDADKVRDGLIAGLLELCR